LNDARSGVDVTVVIFANSYIICLLKSFSFLWKNTFIFPTHSVCTVSGCLFNLFGLMLFASKMFIECKHSDLPSPSTSIFVNPKDRYFVSYFLHLDFSYHFSVLTSHNVFTQTSFVISVSQLPHYCSGCQ